jgi:hypothetical protein
MAASQPQAWTSVCYHIEAALPPNTLSRQDPREPAAYAELRYAQGFDAARLTVHRVNDASGQSPPFQLQDDHAVSVGRVPKTGQIVEQLSRYQRVVKIQGDLS